MNFPDVVCDARSGEFLSWAALKLAFGHFDQLFCRKWFLVSRFQVRVAFIYVPPMFTADAAALR